MAIAARGSIRVLQTAMRPAPEDLSVAPLRRGEEDALAALLAEAFADDPFGRGLGPPDDRRRRALIERVSRRDLARGPLSLGGAPLVARLGPADEQEPVGIAVAYVRAAHPPMPSNLTVASLVYLSAGPSVWLRANRAARDLARSHPGHPHLYLDQLAVAAPHRRRGIGERLLRAVLADADRDRLPTFLETMTAANVAYYERFGFRATGRLPLPGPGGGRGLVDGAGAVARVT